jgi:hypothetical protein
MLGLVTGLGARRARSQGGAATDACVQKESLDAARKDLALLRVRRSTSSATAWAGLTSVHHVYKDVLIIVRPSTCLIDGAIWTRRWARDIRLAAHEWRNGTSSTGAARWAASTEMMR